MKGNAILINRILVNRNDVDEFNRWHREEHLAEMLEIPGIIGVYRYTNASVPTEHLAIYDLETASVLQTAAYVDRVPTPWTRSLSRIWQDSLDRSVWNVVSGP
jgi:hypothetical protein